MQFSPARTGTQTRFGGESLFWSENRWSTQERVSDTKALGDQGTTTWTRVRREGTTRQPGGFSKD